MNIEHEDMIADICMGQQWLVTVGAMRAVQALSEERSNLEDELEATEQACMYYQDMLHRAERQVADLQLFISDERHALDEVRQDYMAAKDRIEVLELVEEAKTNDAILELETELNATQDENDALKEEVKSLELKAYLADSINRENAELKCMVQHLSFMVTSIRHILEDCGDEH